MASPPSGWVLEISENVLIGELGDAHCEIESLVEARRDDSRWTTSAPDTRCSRTCVSSRTDILKVDRTFVSQLGGQSRDREIVAAVTGMAQRG